MNIKKQAGFTFLEILISMMLMVIIGLGTAYILARINVSQRDMNIHLLTVSQMRSILQGNSSCSSGSLISINGATVATPCTFNSVTYNVSAFDNTGNINSGLAAANVAVNSPQITVSPTDSNAVSLIRVPITISP